MFSFIYSQKAWPEGLTYWLWETNPPLHMLILKLWFFVFPTNEFWARIPSLLFGTSTIISVYFLAKLIWNKNVALVSAFFISLHSYNIFWSATARVYSLLMLLSSLSTYYFYKIFFYNSNKKKDKIFLGLINTLLLFSHLSSILLILSQAIIIFAINRKKFIAWLKINLLSFILSAAWLIPSFLIKQNNQLEKSWLLNLHHNFWSATSPFIFITTGIHNHHWELLITGALISLVLINSISRIKKLDIKYTSLLFFLIIPLLITILFSVWHIKMLIYTIPIWIIIITQALNKIIKNKIIIIMVIAIFCLIGISNAFEAIPLTSWSGVKNYIKKDQVEKEQVALIYNNFILRTQIERYLEPNFPYIAFDLARENNMNWDEFITQKNYLLLDFSSEQIDSWFTKNRLYEYDKIILLQGKYSYMILLNNVLEKNNFVSTSDETPSKGDITKQKKIKAPIAGNYYLYTYVKNDSTTSTIQ